MSERLFKNVDACQDMIVEALKYHLLPDRRQSMYSRRTQPRKSYIGLLFAFGADDSGKPNIIIIILLLLLLLLLTKRLAWRLVQKTARTRNTHKKDDMFGRQRKKEEGQQRHIDTHSRNQYTKLAKVFRDKFFYANSCRFFYKLPQSRASFVCLYFCTRKN